MVKASGWDVRRSPFLRQVLSDHGMSRKIVVLEFAQLVIHHCEIKHDLNNSTSKPQKPIIFFAFEFWTFRQKGQSIRSIGRKVSTPKAQRILNMLNLAASDTEPVRKVPSFYSKHPCPPCACGAPLAGSRRP